MRGCLNDMHIHGAMAFVFVHSHSAVNRLTVKASIQLKVTYILPDYY